MIRHLGHGDAQSLGDGAIGRPNCIPIRSQIVLLEDLVADLVPVGTTLQRQRVDGAIEERAHPLAVEGVLLGLPRRRFLQRLLRAGKVQRQVHRAAAPFEPEIHAVGLGREPIEAETEEGPESSLRGVVFAEELLNPILRVRRLQAPAKPEMGIRRPPGGRHQRIEAGPAPTRVPAGERADQRFASRRKGPRCAGVRVGLHQLTRYRVVSERERCITRRVPSNLCVQQSICHSRLPAPPYNFAVPR